MTLVCTESGFQTTLAPASLRCAPRRRAGPTALAAALSALILLAATPSAYAHSGSSGGHGGGFGGGRAFSAHGGEGSIGGWGGHHGGWHGGGWGGFGFYPYYPFGWDDGYFDPYWGPYPYSVVTPGDAAAYAAAPTPPPAPAYWYYCPNTKAYYPYVQQCTSAWQKILTTPR